MPSLLKKAGEQGLLGIDVPEEYGGAELGLLISVLVGITDARSLVQHGLWRPYHYWYAAHRLLWHRRAEAAATCPN